MLKSVKKCNRVRRGHNQIRQDKQIRRNPFMPLVSAGFEGYINGNCATHKDEKKGREEDKLFILDTCCLISLAKSEDGVYSSIKKLSNNGTVVITMQVLDEFASFVKRNGLARDNISDVYHAINDGYVYLEYVDVSKEEMDQMANTLRLHSDKNNQRVGKGDASIVKFANYFLGTFQVHVLSEDSDLGFLLKV